MPTKNESTGIYVIGIRPPGTRRHLDESPESPDHHNSDRCPHHGNREGDQPASTLLAKSYFRGAEAPLRAYKKERGAEAIWPQEIVTGGL